ncbi:MAG: hypothetical protein CVT67_05840 [Actinobacteria bacterium HGW-Actinobacteria-7]|jgi:ABC-2 type transport system permease protein|nr:MAG: hypothetical protein CVT67_05840 [Actinobacteria bacterium HGW-Actinobacteria-7]
MNRILAIIRKEFIHIARDRRVLALVILVPLIQLFLFAYAVSFDVKHVPTAVFDQDHSVASRAYLTTLERSGYFTMAQYVDTYAQADKALTSNEVRVVVVVARGFGDSLAARRAGRVQVLVDGSEPNSAQVAQNFATVLSRMHGRTIAIEQAEQRGVDPAAMGGLSVVTRTWYNPEGRSANYFIPGLMVILLTTVTIQQTANTLVKEKEQGTYEQLLVSPLSRIELMVGKITPWAIIGALEVILVSAAGMVAFAIPFRGSVVVFAVASALYVLCTLGLGLFISALAPSVDVANLLSMLIAILPGFILSGFVFPLDSIPWVLQVVSRIFPAQYFMTITRTCFLKGGDFAILAPQFIALAIFAVVIVSASALVYRERA